MPMLPGLVALVMLAAGGASSEARPATLSTQFSLLEMDGLAWRDALHGELTHVGRQGTSTIWIADRSIVATLTEQAVTALSAPKVTSVPGQTASISDRIVRNYVAALGRMADGPVNHATKVVFQPDIRQVDDGFEAKIVATPEGPGVRARVALEHHWIVAIHAASRTETVTPEGDDDTQGGKPRLIRANYQVPEVWTSRVAGEWHVPHDGVLVISLGVRSVPGKKGLLSSKLSTVRERLAVIQIESVEGVAEPSAEAAAATTIAANRPLPTAPRPAPVANPLATASLPPNVAVAGVVASQNAVCLYDAIDAEGRHFQFVGPMPLPTPPPTANAPAWPGIQVVPIQGFAPPGVVPPALAERPRYRYRDANGNVVELVPAAAPGTPFAAVRAAQQRNNEPPQATACEPHTGANSCVASTCLPIDPEAIAASTDRPIHPDGVFARPASSGREANAARSMPAPPSRNLPPAFDAAGNAVVLPPLPDETAEALAIQERISNSSEPHASAQFPAPRPVDAPTATLVSNEGTEPGAIELKGRVTIRTQDGLVIEADSIVLKPGVVRASGGVVLQTAGGAAPGAPQVDPAEVLPLTSTEPPPAPPQSHCADAPHPASCCPGIPAACTFRDVPPPPRINEAGEGCCEDGSGNRGAQRLSLPEAIRIAVRAAGPKGSAGEVVERVLTSKGIAADGSRIEMDIPSAPLVRSAIRAYATLSGHRAGLAGLDATCRASEALAEDILGTMNETCRRASDAQAVGVTLPKLAAVLATLPGLGGLPVPRSEGVALQLAPKTVVSPDGAMGIDYDVMTAGHAEPASANERLYQYRVPLGRGAVELKVRVSRVQRPISADHDTQP